ncbi:class I tRNA ligase family protein [Pseudomonas sp. 15A4]|nr:class I tRNA ligase family protein [Pseudomonas sp. 15A4]
MGKLLVTITPPTPNGDLHIGHMAGPFLAADIFTRAQRQRGHDCTLVSYSDDYQSYMLRRGIELDRAPQALALENTDKINDTLKKMGIEVDFWMRPYGNSYFKNAVEEMYEYAVKAGAIYKKSARNRIAKPVISGATKPLGGATATTVARTRMPASVKSARTRPMPRR